MCKKIVYLLSLFLLIPTMVFSQERPKIEPATKLEQFLSKKGKIIVKDFNKLGKVSGQYGTSIGIDALTIYEPGKECQKIRGLRIEVEGGGKFERSNTSFLDLDEVESLSQAIAYMINLLEKWKGSPREYTEVIFSTRGDFQLGFFQDGSKVQGFAKSGTVGAANCYYPTSELSAIKSLVDKGISVLKK